MLRYFQCFLLEVKMWFIFKRKNVQTFQFGVLSVSTCMHSLIWRRDVFKWTIYIYGLSLPPPPRNISCLCFWLNRWKVCRFVVNVYILRKCVNFRQTADIHAKENARRRRRLVSVIVFVVLRRVSGGIGACGKHLHVIQSKTTIKCSGFKTNSDAFRTQITRLQVARFHQ